MSTVSALTVHVPSQSSKRRVAAEKPSDFFKSRQNLTYVFLIAHFIPPKSKSAVKTVSVSSDSDFAPLRRCISRIHNLFIKEVTNKKNRLYTRELKLERLYFVISSRFLPNLVIF